MIRIDLSKNGDEQAGTGTGSAIPKELQGLATKLKVPPQLLAILSDAKSLAIVGVGAAIAMLPHLFFSQYRSYVVNQHAKQIQKLKENIEAVNSEITKYSPFEKELNSYEAQKKLVNERLNGVRELLDARNTPVSVLDAVGQSLPQKAWLNNLTYDFKPESSQVTFDGVAYTNEDISDFVDKLTESIYLQEARLNEVGTTTREQINLKTFKIVAVPKARFPAAATKDAPPANAPPPPPSAAPVAPVAPKSFFKKKG